MTRTTARASTVRTVPLTEAATAALEERGLDPEIAESYGVESIVPRQRQDGSCDPRAWIAFPHVEVGRPVHAAYRTITGEKAFWQQAGGRRSFWNHDVLEDRSLYGGPLVITEGHLDALAVIQAGMAAAMSVCDGAPDPEKRRPDYDPRNAYDYVYRAKEAGHFERFQSVVLATDNDNPGRLLLEDLARIIGQARCRWVEYGAAKDMNDMLREAGPEAVVHAVNTAPFVDVPGVRTLSQLRPRPRYPAIRAGKNGIDDHWCFRPGELSVVVGTPGSGKTVLLNDVMSALALTNNIVVAWFSPEQPSSTTHVDRLVQWKTGTPHPSETETRQARDWIERHHVWIDPEAAPEDASVAWFIEQLEAAKIRNNISVAVVDPWNELEHDWPAGWTETEYIGKALKKLNAAARRLAIHLIICAHPRSMDSNKDGKIRKPTPYHVNGGANWYNKTYIGITVHRPEPDQVTFECWKAKFEDEAGYCRPGRINIRLNKYTNRFEVQPTQQEFDDAAENA